MKIIEFGLILSSTEQLLEVENLIGKAPFLSITSIFRTYHEATEIANQNTPHFIITDTETLSRKEIQLLDDFHKSKVPIILLSDDPKESVTTYLDGIIADFVLKPVTLERLIRSISKVKRFYSLNKSNQEVDHIFLKMGRSFRKFLFREIIFIEADGIYTKIQTPQGKYIVNENISGLESKLENYNFLRVHKSYIINTEMIDSFNSTHFDLPFGKIPIGYSYKLRLEGVFNMFIKDNNTEL